MAIRFGFARKAPSVSLLMVCTANICRSPLAHGLMAHYVEGAGLSADVVVDSAGTQVGMKGQRPDARAQAIAKKSGFDISRLKTRKIQANDFEAFDYLLAMDAEHLEALQELCPAEQQHKLALILDFAEGVNEKEIPDPYFGNEAGFERVLELLTASCSGLLQHVQRKHFAETQ
jgi:protein-tyrosine phosphatase